MRKKKTSLVTMCVAASLIVSTFGATAVLAEEAGDAEAAAEQAAAEQAAAEAAAAEAAAAEQAAAEQAAAEAAAAEAAAAEQAAAEQAAAEQAAAEQAAAEQAAAEQAAAEQAAAEAAANRTLVSTNTVYDCDGSGNGYYEYIYSDGSVEYENFYASSSSESSGGSSDSYYEEPSYEETYYEEPVYEETVAEESSAETAAAESPAYTFDGTEWTVEQIASIPDVITGVEDKEYTAGSASKYDIHTGVDFDSDIVHGVLFRTCDVDSSTPGEYDVTYLVYFNREALLDYMEENGIDAADFPGLEDESSDRIEIDVYGKVVIE